jgi:hypothetical protein
VLGADRTDRKIRTDAVNANYHVAFTKADAIQLSQIDFVTVEPYWNSYGRIKLLRGRRSHASNVAAQVFSRAEKTHRAVLRKAREPRAAQPYYGCAKPRLQVVGK